MVPITILTDEHIFITIWAVDIQLHIIVKTHQNVHLKIVEYIEYE